MIDAAPSDPEPARPLKQRVRVAGRAVVAAQIAGQILSLATLAALYRLLDPRDYGLLGMVLPLVMFLRIFSTMGLNIPTVQRSQLSDRELSSLFWFCIAFGAAATLVTAALAPGVAWFYGRAELTTLTPALAGTTLVEATAIQHQALLERDLKLGRLAVCRVAGQFSGSLAGIAAALAGWSVWALVVQLYTELIVLAIVLWCIVPFRPLRPGRGTPIGRHLRMGGFYSAGGVMYFLASRADKVLVGVLLGERALGLYSQAFNLMIKPVYLVTTPLTGVMLGALSRAMHDRRERGELLSAFYRLTAIILFPAAAGLYLVGGDVMVLLGGAKWQPAGALLSILSLGILGQGLINISGPVFSSAGRTGRLFVASVAVAIILLAAYLAGWWLGGRFAQPGADPTLAATRGVAWGFTFSVAAVLALPITIYCLRSAGDAIPPVLIVLVRPALASLVMGLAVYSLEPAFASLRWNTPGTRLPCQILLGAVVYGWIARKDVAWLWKQARQRKTNRASERA